MSIRNAGEIATDAVRHALKAERARVRRLVKKLRTETTVTNPCYGQDEHLAYRKACDDILTALKGTP
jgi:hypothetical protein